MFAISKLLKLHPRVTVTGLIPSSKTLLPTSVRSKERIRKQHVIMEELNGAEEHHGHDTHAIPPQAICNVYKKYQKLDDAGVDADLDIVDFGRGLTEAQTQKIVAVEKVPRELIRQSQNDFLFFGKEGNGNEEPEEEIEECTIYEHKDFPGLRILPSLLPPKSQTKILDVLFHRDLSNHLHTTNFHHDYHIPYPDPLPGSAQPASFFTLPNSTSKQIFTPLNPHSSHKPLNTVQFLSKKLRWLTLGSQYDWNTRAYPAKSPTPFPPDIAALVKGLFKSAFEPESGVVLLYSPKDYMPVHRDVSEQCLRGLASFSLGCDGLFILSKDTSCEDGGKLDEKNEDREMEMCVLRVRSGDCVWMGGETRWCWHAMPKVMGNTCPAWMEKWPMTDDETVSVKDRKTLEKWKGFMNRKRLNISCRQVWG